MATTVNNLGGAVSPGKSEEKLEEQSNLDLINNLAETVARRAFLDGKLEAQDQQFDQAVFGFLAFFEQFGAKKEALIALHMLRTNPVLGEIDFEAQLHEGFAQ